MLYLNRTSTEVSSLCSFSCCTSPRESVEPKQERQCQISSCGTLGTIQGQDDPSWTAADDQLPCSVFSQLLALGPCQRAPVPWFYTSSAENSDFWLKHMDFISSQACRTEGDNSHIVWAMPLGLATSWRGHLQHPNILTEGTCTQQLHLQRRKLPWLDRSDHKAHLTTQSILKVKRRSNREHTVTHFAGQLQLQKQDNTQTADTAVKP